MLWITEETFELGKCYTDNEWSLLAMTDIILLDEC